MTMICGTGRKIRYSASQMQYLVHHTVPSPQVTLASLSGMPPERRELASQPRLTPDLPTLPNYPLTRGVHPPLLSPDCGSTRLRAPLNQSRLMPQRLTEITGLLLGEGRCAPSDHDLTGQLSGEPLGQRIVAAGRVSDEVAKAT